MLLAIDVSNAATALAVWDGEAARHHWRVSTDPERTADELLALLRRLIDLSGDGRDSLTGSILACVVPELAATWVSVCTRLLGQPPLVVGPGIRTGIAVRTADPREVGPDRIANAVAARARYRGAVLVLDMSTALTFDVVGPDASYLGAVIVPGVDVVADALSSRAARLQRIDLEVPDKAIATDTATALQSGIMLGYLGLIENMIGRLRDEIGPAPVIATGEAGWGATLAASCSLIDLYEPLLTLDGLRRIFDLQTRHGPSNETSPSSV